MAGLAGLPALASGRSAALTDAAVIAYDRGFHEDGQGDLDSTVEISPGGRVTFSYPQGASVHNVEFTASQPTSCVQTKKGLYQPIAGAPPLPHTADGPGWEGYCTFDSPGSYSFRCEVHPEMVGSVIVGSGTGTPTPSPSPSPPASPAPSASATASPSPSPAVGGGGATPLPAPPAATPAPPAPAATPARLNPAPKVTGVFARSKRKVSIKGTLASGAAGKVKTQLTYKAGKATRKKTLTLAVKRGRFTGTIKVPARDARKAKKLKLKVTYAGDSRFRPATKTATVKVKK